MSGDSPEIRLSHGYDLLLPRSGEAYPVPCDDWNFLKEKISSMPSQPWFLQAAGTTLIGAGISTLIAIVTGGITTGKQSNAVIIAWAAVAATIICGAVCLIAARHQSSLQGSKSSDVLRHMEIIESRYERKAT